MDQYNKTCRICQINKPCVEFRTCTDSFKKNRNSRSVYLRSECLDCEKHRKKVIAYVKKTGIRRSFRKRLKIVHETVGSFSEGRLGMVFQYSPGWYDEEINWRISPNQLYNKLTGKIDFYSQHSLILPKTDAVHFDIIDITKIK